MPIIEKVKKVHLLLIVVTIAGLLLACYHRANKTVLFYWWQDWTRFNQKYTLLVGSSSIMRLPISQLNYCLNPIAYGFDNGTNEDVLAYLSYAKLEQVSHIIVYIGENDIAQGEDASDTFEQYKQIESLIREQTKAPLALVKLKYSPARSKHHIDFLSFNRMLDTKYGSANNIYLLPYDKLRKPLYYISDGIHLSRQGTSEFIEMLDEFCKVN